jgi:hypothetical protein
MIKKSTASALLLSAFLFAGEALLAQNAQNNVAQNPQPGQQNGSSIDQESIDQEIAMLRSNLRANRKQVIADNMKLTDSEAEKFWPFCHGLRKAVRVGSLPMSLTAENTSAPNFASRSNSKNLCGCW